MNTWYIYNVETREVVRKFNAENISDVEDIYSFYDQDLYGLTNSPAFGCTDGLIEGDGE